MSIENYPARLTAGFYRVREKWDDPSTQVGAYRILANAMTKADEHPGCFVFTEDGIAIYPESESGQEELVTAPVEENVGEGPAEEPTESPVEERLEIDMPTVDAPSEQEPDPQEPVAGGSTEPDTPGSNEEFPEAVEYENDGGENVVAYARLKTLMNIRTGNSLDAELITVYRKGTIVEILQECGNGWLRIKCAESPTGFAYVSNEEGQYAFVGKGLYFKKKAPDMTVTEEKRKKGEDILKLVMQGKQND